MEMKYIIIGAIVLVLIIVMIILYSVLTTINIDWAGIF